MRTTPTGSRRKPFTTDKSALSAAQSVPLRTPYGRAVFWFDEDGKRQAAAFVATHPGYTRLDELVQDSTEGRALLGGLSARPWPEVEEVWWELSLRLAKAASGDVHCFGPERPDGIADPSTHRSKWTSYAAYCHSVFEKVELPELQTNPHVGRIFFNGRELR